MTAAGVNKFLAREISGYWRVDLIGLCLTACFGVLFRTAMFNSLTGAIVVTLLLDSVALVVVLAVRPLFLNLNSTRKIAPRGIALTTLLFAAGALVITLWAKFVWAITGWTVASWTPTQSWLVPWAYYFFVLVSWNIARLWVEAEATARAEKQRAELAAAEAIKAELNHLRHQHDPHFLFNALGGIATEITVHPDAAVRMVHELAAYLRYSLDHHDIAISSFVGDIDAACAYLELQKARFGDDLNFHLAADKAARQRLAPTFLLQPLVENAVKHGLKSGITPVDVTVTASCDGEALRVVVANTGSLHPEWTKGGDPGVGLSVLRRRLALHYPERHSFDMRQSGSMVTAQLELWGEPCSA